MAGITWKCPHCNRTMQRVSSEADPLIGAGIGVAPGRKIHCTHCGAAIEALDVIGGKYDVFPWGACAGVALAWGVIIVLAVWCCGGFSPGGGDGDPQNEDQVEQGPEDGDS